MLQDFRFSDNVNETTHITDDGHVAETTNKGLIVSSDPMIPGFLYQVDIFFELYPLIFLNFPVFSTVHNIARIVDTFRTHNVSGYWHTATVTCLVQ